MIDGLTRPENCGELSQRRKVLALLMRCGGCAMCVHRDRTVIAWGRSICGDGRKRSWPLCMKDGGKPSFTLDEATLQGRAG